jgi:hypothetical protein
MSRSPKCTALTFSIWSMFYDLWFDENVRTFFRVPTRNSEFKKKKGGVEMNQSGTKTVFYAEKTWKNFKLWFISVRDCEIGRESMGLTRWIWEPDQEPWQRTKEQSLQGIGAHYDATMERYWKAIERKREKLKRKERKRNMRDLHPKGMSWENGRCFQSLKIQSNTLIT